MSDALRASFAKLKTSTAQLNEAADEAALAVQTVEDFLARDCSAGVEGWVTVREVQFDPTMPRVMESTVLGYARHEGRYRIVVSVGIDPDNNVTKPWAECDRATKLATIMKLPELIQKLAELVDDQVSGPREAAAQVLAALLRKGGK